MIQTQAQKILLVTPPGAIVDNASPATTAIDTKDADYLDIYVILGATDIAMAALKLQESNDDGSADAYADISEGNYASNTQSVSLPSATADNTVQAFHVDLLGRKRYIDVVATAGDGAAGTYITIIAVLSRLRETPNSASERGVAQELFV